MTQSNLQYVILPRNEDAVLFSNIQTTNKKSSLSIIYDVHVLIASLFMLKCPASECCLARTALSFSTTFFSFQIMLVEIQGKTIGQLFAIFS